MFANATGLLLLMNIEFLSMLILIVYMGAISVLFLFVIMMLNIKLLELNEPLWKYSFVSFYLIGVGIVQFFLFLYYNEYFAYIDSFLTLETNYFAMDILFSGNIYYKNWAEIFFLLNDIKVLGYVLYTYYSFSFIIVGLVLLLAMLATITIALKPVLYSKKQLLYKQSSRYLIDSIYQIN